MALNGREKVIKMDTTEVRWGMVFINVFSPFIITLLLHRMNYKGAWATSELRDHVKDINLNLQIENYFRLGMFQFTCVDVWVCVCRVFLFMCVWLQEREKEER